MSIFLAFLLSLGSFFHGGHAGAHDVQTDQTYTPSPYPGGTTVGGGPVISAGDPPGCWSYYIGGGKYCPAPNNTGT